MQQKLLASSPCIQHFTKCKTRSRTSCEHLWRKIPVRKKWKPTGMRESTTGTLCVPSGTICNRLLLQHHHLVPHSRVEPSQWFLLVLRTGSFSPMANKSSTASSSFGFHQSRRDMRSVDVVLEVVQCHPSCATGVQTLERAERRRLGAAVG